MTLYHKGNILGKNDTIAVLLINQREGSTPASKYSCNVGDLVHLKETSITLETFT